MGSAKEFYGRIGWRLDADFTVGESHAVQFTPPGSPSSIHFGTHVTPVAPGSAQGLLLIVSDIHAAREELVARGVEVSEVYHYAGFNRVDPTQRLSGPAPDRQSYGSWVRSAIRTATAGWCRRSPRGCRDGSGARRRHLGERSGRRAASRIRAHGEHEKRNGGEYDTNWPDWYAEYLVREQSGKNCHADVTHGDITQQGRRRLT